MVTCQSFIVKMVMCRERGSPFMGLHQGSKQVAYSQGINRLQDNTASDLSLLGVGILG